MIKCTTPLWPERPRRLELAWGSFLEGVLGLPQGGLGLVEGSFRADPYSTYMAVSVNGGPYCGCPENWSLAVRGVCWGP